MRQWKPCYLNFYLAALLLGPAIVAFAAPADLPVQQLTWVREEIYLIGTTADTSADTDLESSLDGKTWSRTKAKKRLNTKQGYGLAVVAEGSQGKQFFRLKEGKSGRITRQIEVTILPEAGSPKTGPYLVLDRRWDRELIQVQAGPRTKPPRIRAFMNAVFRLSKGKGGSSISNSYDKMNRAMLDTIQAYDALQNALPIGVSRTFFHYIYDDPTQAKRGEYSAVSLGRDSCEINVVTFMARPTFVFTNIQDPISGIDIRGDGFSVTLPPEGQIETKINGSGLKRIDFVIRYTSGKTIKQGVDIFVKRELTAKEISLRNKNKTDAFPIVKSTFIFSEEAVR